MADEKTESTVVGMRPFYFRRRDTAAALGVSEGVVVQYERDGLIPVIRLPGIRAVRHWHEDVERLALKLKAG